MSGPIPCVLHLEPLSESLRYRCHLERLGAESVLRWWANRLRTMPRVGRIHLIYHGGEAERAALAKALAGSDVALFASEHYSERKALAELARDLGDSAVALVPLGFALAPHDLLERTHVHHQASGNTFTEVEGLPDGTTPALFDCALLLALDACMLPGLPAGAAAAAERLQEAVRTVNVELPFALRGRPFLASSAYGVDATTLPRALAFEGPSDVETLRQVRARLELQPAAGPCDALQMWKEERIREGRKRSDACRHSLAASSEVPRRPGKTRVLYVSNPSAFSGAEQSLCQMVAQIDRSRFDTFALIALDGTFADELRGGGTEVIVRGAEFGRGQVDNVAYAVSLLRCLQPDLVHLNSPDGLPVVTAAKLLGIPVVLHVRNGAMAPYEDFIGSADAVIAVSAFLRREILAFDIPKQRVFTIYDEVDPEHFRKGCFDRRRVRGELGIPAEAKVALMIARIAPNKRHDLMLSAAAEVRKAVPGFHLVLKGDVYMQESADLHADIQQQARELDLMGIVTWLRFVPDIRALHEAADVLVLCSDREGLGRCVVEAMAMELPVVVTDSGGSHELVGDGERGYTARGGDAQDLAAKLVDAFTKEDWSRQMAERARAFAVAELSAQAAARQVMGIYDRLVAPSD